MKGKRRELLQQRSNGHHFQSLLREQINQALREGLDVSVCLGGVSYGSQTGGCVGLMPFYRRPRALLFLHYSRLSSPECYISPPGASHVGHLIFSERCSSFNVSQTPTSVEYA